MYRVFMRQWAAGKPVRLICLKSRRHGISTLMAMLGFWRTRFFEDSNMLISAHEGEAAKTVFGMYKRFLDCMPEAFEIPLSSDTKDLIAYEKPHRSECTHRTVAPGGGTKERAGKGRSGAVHFKLADEAAFWDEPENYWTGVSQCIEDYPETVIAIVSTANSFGWFYEQWSAAAMGWEVRRTETGIEWVCTDPTASQSDMEPVFLSWLGEPKYSRPFETETEKRQFLADLDENEQSLLNDLGASPEQVHWRRRTLYSNKFNGDLARFQQEYPATPSEAFKASGRKVFDMMALSQAEARIVAGSCVGRRFSAYMEDGAPKLLETDAGIVTLYRPPELVGACSLGVDGSYGKPNGDFMSGQMLVNDTWEQAAVIHVREAEQEELAETAVVIGRLFNGGLNEALAVVEINGPGLAVQEAMERLGYGNFYARTSPDTFSGRTGDAKGWWSSTKTRMLMVRELQKAVAAMNRGQGLILHHAETVLQLMGWVMKRNYSGKVKEAPANSSGYDDLISSLGVALVGGCIENGTGAPIASSKEGNPTGKVDMRYVDPAAVALMAAVGKTQQQQTHPTLGANW